MPDIGPTKTISDNVQQMFDVIGLGVSTLDLLQIVDELPDKEIVQRAHETTLQGGGPIATALVTLAKLGSQTAMIDSVGNDWRGKLIIKTFKQAGVSTAYIPIEAGATSSIASILVRKKDGKRVITFSPGTSRALDVNDVTKDMIGSAKILHLNGRHPIAALKAVELAKTLGVTVSFDGGAHRYRPQLDMLISQTDILIAARQFALQSVATKEINIAAERLLKRGPKLVVITAGKSGSWVFAANKRPFHQSAVTIKNVIDTTGAGDAFHGAFLHGIVNGLDLRETTHLASAVAALNIRQLGGQVGLPTYQEALEFVKAAG